jgi:hypothetical protein
VKCLKILPYFIIVIVDYILENSKKVKENKQKVAWENGKTLT